jgi:hypothetical protein
VLATLLPEDDVADIITARTDYVSNGGTEPSWTGDHDRTLVLPLKTGGRELVLEVWNHNTVGNDDVIGSVR